MISEIESPEDQASSDAAPATPEQPAGDPDDFDATPAERVDVLGRKRENSIPHSRVKTMIAKREQAVIAQVAKAIVNRVCLNQRGDLVHE